MVSEGLQRAVEKAIAQMPRHFRCAWCGGRHELAPEQMRLGLEVVLCPKAPPGTITVYRR